MTLEALIELFNEDQRRGAMFAGMRRERGPGFVRLVAERAGDSGMVVYSELEGADVEAAIEAQVAYFGELGQGFEWKVYSFDRPPDLKERLAARGFEVGEAEAVLVLDLAQAPERLLAPVRHSVRRLRHVDELDVVIGIEEAVWEEDFSALREYLRESLESAAERMSIYVAEVEGVAASAAWVYFAEGSQFGSLWGGSTLAGYRKRGLYTALLAARLQEAMARGARYLTTDASPDSRPILEKLGFGFLGYTWECNWGA